MSPLRHVEHDDRAGLVTDAPRRILVEVGVDRELNRLSADVGLGIELLDQLALRRDLDALTAWLAAKHGFQRLLKPFLADLHTGMSRSGFLFSFSYSLAEAGPT